MKLPLASLPVVTGRQNSLVTGVLCLTMFINPMFINPAQVETAPAKFVSFQTFIRSVKTAKADTYLASKTAKVKDAPSFEQMRQYLLDLYSQVHVRHSYVLGSQTFDCVPIDEQPSLRAPDSHKAGPRATTRLEDPVAGPTAEAVNAVGCEDGTIPMRRITLQQLSQFRTLGEFLQKGPNSVGMKTK